MVVVAGGGGRAQLWWGSLAALLMLLCYTIAPSRLAPSVLLDSETPQDHSGLLGQLSRVALELWDGTMADASGKSPKSPSLQQADAGMRSSCRIDDIEKVESKDAAVSLVEARKDATED